MEEKPDCEEQYPRDKDSDHAIAKPRREKVRN
jgi:hypothetical protein